MFVSQLYLAKVIHIHIHIHIEIDIEIEIQYYIDHFAVNCNLVSCNSIQYFTIGHRNYHLVNCYFGCNCNCNSFLMIIR